jgi:CHAT domain-containing protein
VKIRLKYCRLLLLSSQSHKPQSAMEVESGVESLQSLFSSLLLCKEYHDAYLVANLFGHCLSSRIGASIERLKSRDWSILLLTLSEHPDLPLLVKAKTLNALSEQSENLDDGPRYLHLETEAEELFLLAEHTYGHLDIRLRRECRLLKEKVGDLDQVMQKVIELLKEYEAQEYWSGLLSAIDVVAAGVSGFFKLDLQLALIHESQDVADRSGGQLITFSIRVKLLARWLIHSVRSTKILEAGLPLYESTKNCSCLRLRGFIAQILSQAYTQDNDFAEAGLWADRCSVALANGFPEDKADAATLQLQAKLHANLTLDEKEVIIASAEQDISNEIQAGLFFHAIKKMEWVLTRVLLPNRDARQRVWLERFEAVVAQLSAQSKKDGDAMLANMYQYSANLALQSAKARTDTDLEKQASDLLENSVALYMKNMQLVEAANTRQMQSMVYFALFQKTGATSDLQRAYEMVSIALDAFRLADATQFTITASYWQSFFLYEAWLHGWLDAHPVLNALEEAERAATDERMELSILGGLKALEKKRGISASPKIRDIYNRALLICVRKNLVAEAWKWIQLAKARSLSDILGLGVLMPEYIKSEAMEEKNLKDLLVEEERIMKAITEAEMTTRLKLRGELHIIHKRMHEFPALKAVMDIRVGNPVSQDQLVALTEWTSSNCPGLRIVFVDWVFVNGNVYVCVYQTNQVPKIQICAIGQAEVETWKKSWNNDDWDDVDEDEDDFCLRKLDALVAPFATMIEEEDLIICAATGILHSIPMHALWIQGEPLILRNPIVYCASLTTFFQCWQRAAERKSGANGKTVLAVYEKSLHNQFIPQEQARIYKTALNLGTSIKARVFKGKQVVRSTFIDEIQSSCLIHFHGHCLFQEAILTDQSIVLADGNYSVKEVFDIKLQAPHITLVACDSASQGIAVGDEPLGLVTALLCAGASSVIGTLWITPSRTGREFSEHFYASINATDTSEEITNLAMALRKAVIALRRNPRTRHPYHWASFVLHGAWFLKSSDQHNLKAKVAARDPIASVTANFVSLDLMSTGNVEAEVTTKVASDSN